MVLCGGSRSCGEIRRLYVWVDMRNAAVLSAVAPDAVAITRNLWLGSSKFIRVSQAVVVLGTFHSPLVEDSGYN